MKWNEPYSEQDTIKILSQKSLITLNQKYDPGSGDIMVFVNGSLAVKNADYTESGPWSLQFSFDLMPDDTVVVQHQKLW
ncbi:hypothetical protein ACK8P5_26530 (plasmid) [Paenibacillus sp. EC2-1]|uniref:hypothetical protein n=1 Tax=Paenibacillus sp. EC2-1 TaxID=3388665 RepID=UPI003BEEFD13